MRRLGRSLIFCALLFSACHGGPRGEDGPAIATGTNVREIVPICSIARGETDSTSRVTCSAGRSTSLGETPVEKVAADLSLQWQKPEPLPGSDVKDISCTLVSDLRQDCTVTTASSASAQIRFALVAQNVVTKESATSTRIVVVPYRLQTFGHTVEAPSIFTPGASEKTGETATFGTKPVDVALSRMPFKFTTGSLCSLASPGGEERLFIASGSAIYSVRHDKESGRDTVSLFSGIYAFSDNTPGDALNPLNLSYNEPLVIACDGARQAVYAAYMGFRTFEKSARQLWVTRFELAADGSAKAAKTFVGEAARVYLPAGATIGADGSLFVLDGYLGLVERVTADGQFSDYARLFPAPIECKGDGLLFSAVCDSSFGGLVAEASGALVAASAGHQQLYRISSGARGAASVAVIAGSDGTAGLDGDGGPAISARLSYPQAVTVVGKDIFFIDRGNNRVRKIDSAGVISTYTGGGTTLLGEAVPHAPIGQIKFVRPPTTLGASARFGLLVGTPDKVLIALGPADAPNEARLVAQAIDTLVRDGDVLPPTDADRYLSRRAFFGQILQLAHDVQGNAVFVEQSDVPPTARVIRLEPTAEGDRRVARVLVDGSPGRSSPAGIVAAADGAFFFTDAGQHTVNKLVGTTVTPIAGIAGQSGYSVGVTADKSKFNQPFTIAIAPNGHLFVTDRNNHVIRELIPRADGKYDVSLLAGAPGVAGLTYPEDGASSSDVRLAYPSTLATDDANNVYFSFFVPEDGLLYGRVYRIDAQKKVHLVAGGGSITEAGSYADARSLRLYPSSLKRGENGKLYVIDNWLRVIALSPADGGTMSARFLVDAPPPSSALCATGVKQGFGQASADGGLLSADLGALCRGTLRGVDVFDTCGSANGKYIVRLAQNFGFASPTGLLVEAAYECAK